jgi:hypothetical protein
VTVLNISSLEDLGGYVSDIAADVGAIVAEARETTDDLADVSQGTTTRENTRASGSFAYPGCRQRGCND